MCRHHRKTQGDKVAIAKLDKTSMKKFQDSQPKLTTVLQFGQWPDKKVITVPQIEKKIEDALSNSQIGTLQM